MYRSVEDHVVDDLSAQLLKTGAVNTTVREVILEDSYHVATLDNDAPTIFAGTVEFMRSLSHRAQRHDRRGGDGPSPSRSARRRRVPARLAPARQRPAAPRPTCR